MISDLLDADSISSGHPISLNLEDVDLKIIAEEVISDFSILTDRKIELRASGGQFKCTLDRVSIRRVIDNLITNAVKYGTPNTPVTITLDESSSFIIVRVHNTGPPIPENEQQSLIKPFYRSKATNLEPGWGLGLTIVSGIISAHHGTLEVKSNMASGTTFSFQLPRN
jgi:signal transduction histidine kinase